MRLDAVNGPLTAFKTAFKAAFFKAKYAAFSVQRPLDKFPGKLAKFRRHAHL